MSENHDRQELSAKVLAEAEKRSKSGLGVCSSRGWYQNSIRCPVHDDGKASCSVKKDGSLYCHACDQFWPVHIAAELLGIVVDKSGDSLNRSNRRVLAARGKRIGKKSRDHLKKKIDNELPEYLKPLMRLILSMSLRHGTCVMSHPTMGRIIGRCERTVLRQLKMLRYLGFVKKVGYYVIGFNPALHHRGLWMRVNVECPWFIETGVDKPVECRTMSFNRLSFLVKLPQLVTMPGLTALIHYDHET